MSEQESIGRKNNNESDDNGQRTETEGELENWKAGREELTILITMAVLALIIAV